MLKRGGAGVWIITAIILLVIAGIAYFLFAGNSGGTILPIDPIGPDYDEDDLIEQLHFNICERDTINENVNIDEKKVCVQVVSSYKDDSSLCDGLAADPNISAETLKAFCLNGIAEANSDIAYCNGLENDEDEIKDNCYYGIAQKTEDVQYCRLIQDDLFESTCIRKIAENTDDTTICENLEGTQRELCIRAISYDRDDLDLCLSVGESKNNCYSNFIFRYYFDKDDKFDNADFCDSIKDDVSVSLYDSCMKNVALRTENFDLCESMETSFVKQNCLRDAASKENDASYCSQIEDDKLKERCEIRATAHQNSITRCNSLEFIEESECYTEFAFKKDDASICDNIEDLEDRDTCIFVYSSEGYGESLDEKKNVDDKYPESCNLHSQPYNCLWWFSALSDDKSICNHADESNDKENCNILRDATKEKNLLICAEMEGLDAQQGCSRWILFGR